MKKSWLWLGASLLIIAAAQVYFYHPTEPFFNNDETRHVLTGIYFRDVLHDLPLTHLRAYTINYYLQFPALGLLIWPPLFYLLLGIWQSVFGDSMPAARALIWLCAAIACAYLYFLVRRADEKADERRAALSVVLFGLAPLFFEHARQVMLETPTLMFALAATFYFTRYLDAAKRRDIFLTAIATACAALTRFDAIYLAPLFGLLIAAHGEWQILKRGEVWAAICLAMIFIAPSYLLTALNVGALHAAQATGGLTGKYPPLLSWQRLTYYPGYLPNQIGWLVVVFGVIGLAAGLRDKLARRNAAVFWLLIVAVYATFTPINEVESRHVIYWLPAWAFFAAAGVRHIGQVLKQHRLIPILSALLIIFAAWNLTRWRLFYLTGYEAAARYVLAQTDAAPYCLFVGRLNGDLIYQFRRRDDTRRIWTLRADKILFSESEFEHQDLARSEAERLTTIYRFDPTYIIVEDPQEISPAHAGDTARINAETEIRRTLAAHPERFRLEQTFPVDSNLPGFRNMRLLVYRNLQRNPQPVRTLSFEVLNLGGKVSEQ